MYVVGAAILALAMTTGPGNAQQEPASTGDATDGGGAGRKPTAGLRIPLTFEPNVGQVAPAAEYLARAADGAFAFTPSGVSMAPATGGETVRMRFVDAGSSPRLVPRERLPGVVNYLYGRDAAEWRTGVPTYGGLEYAGLYEGIRLDYADTAHGRLKGTWTVSAGADPAQIRWRYDGARVRVDAAGDLRISASRRGGDATTLVERAPEAWQHRGGERVAVPVRYRVGSDGTVGFALGAYDPERPLTIDPELVFSTYLGGLHFDEASDVAVDQDGAVHLTGKTLSSGDFPLRDAHQPEHGGGYDAYVTKLSPDGSSLVYSTYFGDGNDDYGNAIEVDADGNAYVAGYTASPYFPTTSGAYLEAEGGSRSDGFVAKFDATGSLRYSTLYGTGGYDEVYGLAVDDAGSAHLAGAGSHSLPECPGTNDAFVAKLDPTGSSLDYSTCFGGGDGVPEFPDSETDIAHDVALDDAGDALVTGYTEAVDFPTTPDALQSGYAGGSGDAFATTFDSSGAIVYSSYLGGSSSDYAWGVAVDGAGSVYLAGVTQSSDFPTNQAFQNANAGFRDAFVTKLTPGDDGLAYSTYLGGSEATGNGHARDEARDIAVDGDGHAWVVGETDSTDFPTEQAIQPSLGCCDGARDAFVTELSADGSGLLFSSYLGGEKPDWAYGVALDTVGGAYLAGLADSEDFPTTAGAFQPAAAGIPDAFVTKVGAGTGDTGSTEPEPSDTVEITKAEYRASKQELRVEATSTASEATLTVEVTATGEVIGTLDGKNGRYRGRFDWPSNPEKITVRSSEGGSATAEVTAK